MSKDDLLADEVSDQASLMANWETRISLLEHDVSVLQGKVPKSKIRRAFWLFFNGFLIATPIVGGCAAIYGEDPWKTTVVAGGVWNHCRQNPCRFLLKDSSRAQTSSEHSAEGSQIAYGSRVQHHWQQLDDMTKPTGAPSWLQ